jgi:hypothetical protein
MGASIFFLAAMIRVCEATSHDFAVRIIAAVKNIDAPMLTRVWQGLEYHMDVCCVACGAHIEHL